MHDSLLIPRDILSEVNYKQANTVLNHFYEKLLLLKDQMNTELAKKMALKRHQFLVNFLEKFKDEWNVDL